MPVQVFTLTRMQLQQEATLMHMTHIHRTHRRKHANSHTSDRCECLCSDWALKPLELGRSMQACSAKGCYFGCVYSSHSHPPPTHTHRILNTFTRKCNAKFSSLADVPWWKTAPKNSHRWCCTPPASVTSPPPHPSPPVSYSSGSQRSALAHRWGSGPAGRRFPRCLLCLPHDGAVYRSVCRLSSCPFDTSATRASCLNLWYMFHIVPRLPATPLATSLSCLDWRLSFLL